MAKSAAKPAVVDSARALARGDAKVLKPLLATWRDERSAALGDLIERFGTHDVVAKAVAKLAEKGSSAELTRRVRGLAAHAADPRIASALVGLVEAPPFTAGSLRPTWGALFEQLIETHTDPRSIPRLTTIRIEDTFGSTTMAGWIKGKVAAVLDELRERFPAGAPRLRDEAVLAKLVPAPEPATPTPVVKLTGRKRVEAELLAAIAEAPGDDAPRLVYADLVAEQGDSARAELIQLQLARAKTGDEPTAHEQKLLAKHAAKWLAPILPGLTKDSWQFVRGFLDSVRIRRTASNAAEVARHPLWSTVRFVKLSENGDASAIAAQPIMKNLKIVEFATRPRGLRAILASKAPIEELRRLYLPNIRSDAELHRRLVAGAGLPNLRLVEMSGVEAAEGIQIWRGGLDRTGMQLVIADYDHQLASWWMQLVQAGPKRATVTIATQLSESRMTDDRTITVTVSPRDITDGVWNVAVATGLAADDGWTLQRGVLHHLVLRLPAGWQVLPAPSYSSYKTLKSVVDATVKQAKTLGTAITIEEGTWPLVAIGTLELHL